MKNDTKEGNSLDCGFPSKMSNKLDKIAALNRLQKRIKQIHALREEINAHLAKVHANNLSQALTQKKRLKKLQDAYVELTKEVRCLPPADAVTVLEPEFDYIVTLENILETTQEIKRKANIGQENLEALESGLIQFYDGLRLELAKRRETVEAENPVSNPS
jgi:DNA repair exonuclease SbcCD ATPase subunit